ncbi:MAG: hypothetical protein NC489_09125 [Ruminococcus flavefaciens]|nr:hypothetical protein [Ruminococcus flavefaciens]
MVRAELLDPFVIYKAKPPILMPETLKNRKKNQAYIVLAPTIEEEFKFLSTDDVLRYRYLTKYFIEKRWPVQLFGSGKQIIKPNDDDRINALLAKYKRGNLADIDGVTSYLETYKGDVLRQFNVLLEVNHVTEAILNNPKDRRLVRDRVPQWRTELIRAISNDYIGPYGKNTVIPMNLWFTPSEFTNAAQILRPTGKNAMGILLKSMCDPEIMKQFGTIYLVDQNVIMRIDGYVEPGSKNETAEDFIYKMILKFMQTAKRLKVKNIDDSDREGAAFVVPDDRDEPVVEDKKTMELHQKEQRTETDMVAEELATAVKGDIDRLGDDDEKKVKDIAQKVTQAKSKAPDKTVPPEATPDTPVPVSAEIKDVPIENTDVENLILAAKMSGTSTASEKRNQILREKYKDLKMGTTPVAELVEESEHLEIPPVQIHANTINESMKQIRAHQFERSYKENLMQHHLISILMHFSTVDPAMFLNKDIQIEDISTRTDRILRYTVEFEDANRKRHRFSFKLPKMYKDKYLYLNGQELNITHQKLPFPITKVTADRCQLVTNYNKVFVYRYGAALSPRIVKLKKLLSGSQIPGIAVTKGNCTILNKSALTTIEFDELASVFVRIKLGKMDNYTTFNFDIGEAGVIWDLTRRPTELYTIDGLEDNIDSLFPVAYRRTRNGSTLYWLSGVTNRVYDQMGGDRGEYSEFLINTIIEYLPQFEKELSDTSAGTKFMYSRARIMAQDIPLIVVMGAADPDGLIGALEKGHINYRFEEKRPHVDKDVTGVIPFSNGYLVYDRYPFENSLLLNGLAVIPTKEYNFYEMGMRETYVDIFDLLCNQKSLADNMASFNYMMVDPITKDVLKRLGMPTDFVSLLFYCNGVLVDNAYQIDSNYNNSRIRSTEIIMAHLYRYLAIAWSNVRSGRTDTFSIPEDCVIKELLTSKIVDPKSKLNINLELENDRNVKLKGPSGMNEDHSFTIEKRAYHESMRGIVGTNSTPSGEVGINRHMVANARIEDALGFITVDSSEGFDSTELLTPAELLQPFGPESADVERLCMSISQAKHLVPVMSQCSCPVSYDFERVAPYLSNDFAFTAKKDGKVIDISEDLMIVQYSDGTTDDIDLSDHPVKNTDGGFFIMNKMDTKYKVGQKFSAGQILAFDKKVVNDLDFFGDPCANVGTLARVAFETNGSVFEDSGYITDDFAHRFSTKITKEKRVILSPFANIKYIAKIGQEVQANDPILAFDDTEDEFSSQLLQSITDQMADDDEIIATSAPIVSKYTGVIRDIQIIYTIPLESMTPSLRKVVEEYKKDAAKREKVIHKYMNIQDSNTIVKNSEMSVADASGKVGGSKIGDGVEIAFYIEYVDVAGNGDKGSIGALKFTTCNVIPTDLAGFTESRPDKPIDVYVSALGAFKRMVADVEKIGVLTKVLVETKHQWKQKYHDRIKAELKKK